MKKLLLMALACFTAIAANAWSVKFTNPSNWSTVNIYAWDNGYSGKANSWPGTAMTKGSDGIWSYEEAGTVPAKIIFNNGSGTQTGDLTFGTANDGKTFNYYGPEDAVLNEYKVYFDNSTAKWAKVYLYGWDGVATNSWPGNEVTETDDRGYYVFTFKGETAPTGGKIIWNNGGNGSQTPNLDWETDGLYNQNGPVTGNEETYTVYFNNTAGWDAVYVYTFNPELCGSWPGTELKTNAQGLYQWDYVSSIEPSPEGIIFNCGSNEKQTGDLTYKVGETYTNGDGSVEVWVNLNGDFHPDGDNGVQPVDGIATWTNQAIGSYPVYLKVWDGSDKYYYSATPVQLDTWTTLTAASEGTATYIAGQTSDCVYDVEYNVSENQIKFTLVSGGTVDPDEAPQNLYLLGNINSGDDWSLPGTAFTNEGDGFFSLEDVTIGDSGEGFGYFALTSSDSSDWEVIKANRYGPAENNTDLASEEEGDFTKIDGTAWKIEPGVYTFNVDWESQIVVAEKTGVAYTGWWFNFLYGVGDNWPQTEGVEGPGDEYEVTYGEKVALTTDTEFLVKIWNGSDDVFYTYDGTTVPVNQWVKLNERQGESGGNMKADVENGKEYNIRWNFNDHSIYIDVVTGIEGINAENGNAVYYNLQGVKVQNPKNGLFIKVVDGKAAKVLVRK